jgi:hypothetical protein
VIKPVRKVITRPLTPPPPPDETQPGMIFLR